MFLDIKNFDFIDFTFFSVQSIYGSVNCRVLGNKSEYLDHVVVSLIRLQLSKHTSGNLWLSQKNKAIDKTVTKTQQSGGHCRCLYLLAAGALGSGKLGLFSSNLLGPSLEACFSSLLVFSYISLENSLVFLEPSPQDLPEQSRVSPVWCQRCILVSWDHIFQPADAVVLMTQTDLRQR